MDSKNTYQAVQDHYGTLARAKSSEKYSATVAKAFGYSDDELSNTPKEANLGLSCGNPLALASLREGETVIDLGSGAGFDVFLASKKVGRHGRAIGVDMNRDMLGRARQNQSKWLGTENVTFVEANITSIPLEDGVADCVISNCVVNLVPDDDKQKVFAEMYRLLKPGGRVAISDTLARKALSEELRRSVALYVGCVAGASLRESYERWLKEVGFTEITIVDTESDLNVYVNSEGASGCCGQSDDTVGETKGMVCCVDVDKGPASCCGVPDPSVTKDVGLADIDLNEWVGSFKIFAVKV